jgi:hypothetical protein
MTIQVHNHDRHNTDQPGFYNVVASATVAEEIIISTAGLIRNQAVQQGMAFQVKGAAVNIELTLATSVQAKADPASVPWDAPIVVPGSGAMVTSEGKFASAMRINFTGPGTLYIGVM